jgi:hypothetical protein
MMRASLNTRCDWTPSPKLLLLGIIPIQFLCFYWWSAHSYYFTGDALYYFSRQIHSLPELASRFLSVDEMYQYRPLTYIVFTFVFFPLFGNYAPAYHLAAYIFSSINALFACACMYYWTGPKAQMAWYAAIFLVLNPVHFFPSFGPTYIDQWLSSFFYFLTFLIIFRQCANAHVLAPITFVLALLSKEHSVMLPVHVMLVLLVLNVPFRDAVRRTCNLWIVLAAFMTFQLVIRHGSLFAPPGSNENLQFNLSAARVLELAKGAKAAIFYPENYSMDGVFGIGRWMRVAVLIPLLAVLAIALKRKPRLALSGLAWFAIALLPIAFLRQAPFPRHYYLGLPGLSIVFACAIPGWRAMIFATPLIAFITMTNVQLYARESWIAIGAQRTKTYLSRIEAMLDRTRRPSFYVTNGGDPQFFWHVDGGAAIPHILKRATGFRFAALMQPLETDSWLNNGVNVILPRDGELIDAVETGQFPPVTAGDICGMVRKLTSVDSSCSVLFRGRPVLDGSRDLVETPNRLPIFEVPEGTVTLSRTTIRIATYAGFHFKGAVRVVPESFDGVVVEIYKQHKATFEKVFSQTVAPGERRELIYSVLPFEAEHVLIRIHPGENRNEQSDWLIWER